MQNILYKNEQFVWYDFQHPTKEEITEFTKEFNLNYYSVLDSLEPGHLPKFEKQKDSDFILIRFYLKSSETFLNSVREYTNKLALFYGKDYIISIHQNEVPFFNEIKEKYLNNKEQQLSSVNELVTKILWNAINTYLSPILNVSERINFSEEHLFKEKLSQIHLNTIYDIKRESSTLKRVLILSNEVINTYETTEQDASSLQDVKELVIKLINLSEQNIEDSHNILNTYLSLSSKKTNDTMQLLTVFSAFFLPLTYIVGIYGMNFDFMPELHYKYAYPIIMAIQLIIVVLIFVWFKRKKIL